MGQYNIQDDYDYRIVAVASLIALCGEDETRAADITVDELMGLLAGHYYPDGIVDKSTLTTAAQRQMYRVFTRTKQDARRHCYYRDVLKARMA